MEEKGYRDISSQYCLILTIFLCLTAVILSSCRKEKSTVESVKNDKIISNREPLWKDDQRITLRLIQKIGGIDTEKEEYFFNRNFDMVQDSRGNKYVLSHGDSKVRKFDKEWNYVLSFVKAGQGPGEVERSACKDNSTLMAVMYPEKETIRRFSFAEDYGESDTTVSANEVFFTHDKRDNIYMAFENQNRMEKYSPAGDLIWRVETFYEIIEGDLTTL